MTVFKIKLLAFRNGVMLFLWNMTGVYDNKYFSQEKSPGNKKILEKGTGKNPGMRRTFSRIFSKTTYSKTFEKRRGTPTSGCASAHPSTPSGYAISGQSTRTKAGNSYFRLRLRVATFCTTTLVRKKRGENPLMRTRSLP